MACCSRTQKAYDLDAWTQVWQLNIPPLRCTAKQLEEGLLDIRQIFRHLSRHSLCPLRIHTQRHGNQRDVVEICERYQNTFPQGPWQLPQKVSAKYDGLPNIVVTFVLSILLLEVDDGTRGQRVARLATKAHSNMWLQIIAAD